MYYSSLQEIQLKPFMFLCHTWHRPKKIAIVTSSFYVQCSHYCLWNNTVYRILLKDALLSTKNQHFLILGQQSSLFSAPLGPRVLRTEIFFPEDRGHYYIFFILLCLLQSCIWCYFSRSLSLLHWQLLQQVTLLA